jgi:methyl-accepting chemotaxis protein/methyl-accepting chemotaxis protein-1 (serine sensor receptor)
MTIKQRIGWSVAVMLLVIGILASYSFNRVGTLGRQLDTALTVSARRVDIFNAIRARLQEITGLSRAEVASFAVQDEASAVKHRKGLEAASKRTGEMIDDLRPLMRDAAELRMLQVLENHFGAIREFTKQYAEHARRGDFPAAQQLMEGTIFPASDEFERVAVQFSRTERQAMAAEGLRARDEVRTSAYTVLALIGLCAAGGAVVLWVTWKSSKSLYGIAVDVAETAHQVSAAAGQLATSSQSTAEGTSEQTASIDETSASTEQVRSAVHQAAERMGTATKSVEEAIRNVQHANEALTRMVGSMREISTSSDKISRINKVIDEIAFQTNILALNAAVEAARAGEAGLGFAVVSEEVRNLAQRSAEAAKETSQLIEESSTRVHEGRDTLESVVSAIRMVTTSATTAKQVIDEVSSAAADQRRGLDAVARELEQIGRVTQQTAAGAEEQASASEELSAQAHAMTEISAKLRRMVDRRETVGATSGRRA